MPTVVGFIRENWYKEWSREGKKKICVGPFGRRQTAWKLTKWAHV